MTYPPVGPVGEVGGPSGYTYATVVVRVDDPPHSREEVLAGLRELRFSGWVGQPEDGWLAAVVASGDGTVATGRRGVVEVGEWLADRLGATVVAIRVVRDRQLLIVMWAGGEEVGRYLSDPSYGLGSDDDTLPDAYGVEHAAAFAAACGHPENAEDLEGLLGEELDPDSVFESERLAGVLRLLGLPRWLVAAPSLPHDVPTGPRRREVTRLGAGMPGALGWLSGRVVNVVRKRRPPPPAVTDAPRGSSGMDPWLM
jgi:hypothetical protein